MLKGPKGKEKGPNKEGSIVLRRSSVNKQDCGDRKEKD